MNPKVPVIPSDAVVTAFNTTELAKIREGVKNVIGLKSEADLSVDTYADIPAETHDGGRSRPRRRQR